MLLRAPDLLVNIAHSGKILCHFPFAATRRRFKAFRSLRTDDASLVPLYLRLVIQDRVKERIVNLDLPVIGNEAELAKFVHEKAVV